MSADTTPEQRQRFLATMQASSRQLLDLINDLLDLSKIEAGGLEIEKKPFRFDELLRDVGIIYAEAARQKGLVFEPDIAEASQLPTLIGDSLRIKQILINLLDNAIKFTAAGTVILTTKVLGTTVDSVKLEVTVKDTGVGISSSAQLTIFGKFNQADSSITRRFGGTGLGLAITRNLIEHMGGRVDVVSEEGRGSCFTIQLTLPIATAQPVNTLTEGVGPGLPVPKPNRLSGSSLLVVEDYEPNRLVLDSMLKLLGYRHIAFAETGPDALNMFDSVHFDLILMDIQMPGMDGLSVTREIRGRERRRGKAPAVIIGVTAHALADDRQRCLDAGMDSYLAKPYSIESLKTLLHQYLHAPVLSL